MPTKPTDEQKRRYQQAQERERQEDKGILSLVTSALTRWLTTLLRPIVGKVARAIVDWFAGLFR